MRLTRRVEDGVIILTRARKANCRTIHKRPYRFACTICPEIALQNFKTRRGIEYHMAYHHGRTLKIA